MTCNICGFIHGERVVCPSQDPDIPVGWLCPACNKGNAPDTKTCGHCARRERLGAVMPHDTGTSGKISIVRTRDMTPDWSV